MGEKSKKGGWCGWIIALVVVAAAAGAIVVLFMKKHNGSGSDAASGASEKKYGDALKIAMQFFDVQKSGKLVNNKISWRGDSAVKDGSQEKLDLSQGMYDAGDHMKFNFPMAYTATVLSWAILEYGNQMKGVGQLEPAEDSLKWITDYLINCHPKDDVLYIQVGDADADHKCWDRPEDMTEARPLIQINASTPGTEVAAETAAAMAAASLVFKSKNSAYSSNLLKHAKQLFTFADKHRGTYSENIPEVATYYNSTGYGDELLWAASWLYHATGDQIYFDYATGKNADSFGNFGNPTWFSWDNKLAGTQVLLSRVSFFNSKVSNSDTLQQYKKTAEAVMCGLLPKSPTATSSRTDSNDPSKLLLISSICVHVFSPIKHFSMSIEQILHFYFKTYYKLTYTGSVSLRLGRNPLYFLKLHAKSKPNKQIEAEGVTATIFFYIVLLGPLFLVDK